MLTALAITGIFAAGTALTHLARAGDIGTRILPTDHTREEL